MSESRDTIGLLTMVFDLEHNLIKLSCSPNMKGLTIVDETKQHIRDKRDDGPQVGQLQPKLPAAVAPDLNKVTQSAPVNKAQVKLDGNPAVVPNGVIKQEPQQKPVSELGPPETKAKDDRNDSNGAHEANSNPEGDHKAVQEESLESKEQKTAEEIEKPSQAVPQDNVGSCGVKPFKMDRCGDECFSFAFRMIVDKEENIGLYSMFFHSCPNYDMQHFPTRTSLSVDIVEKNLDNFLSAGEIPLPGNPISVIFFTHSLVFTELSFGLSLIFFMMGIVWIYVVKAKREEAFKIHYLMGLLVFVKALALLFHGVSSGEPLPNTNDFLSADQFPLRVN